jgi:hypothetical protein
MSLPNLKKLFKADLNNHTSEGRSLPSWPTFAGRPLVLRWRDLEIWHQKTLCLRLHSTLQIIYVHILVGHIAFEMTPFLSIFARRDTHRTSFIIYYGLHIGRSVERTP